jgi:hypothetical protein
VTLETCTWELNMLSMINIRAEIPSAALVHIYSLSSIVINAPANHSL